MRDGRSRKRSLPDVRFVSAIGVTRRDARCLALLGGLLASSCSPSAAGLDAGRDAGSDVDLDADRGPPSLCPGPATRVTGTVLGPNGADPVPDALVYVVPDSHTFAPASPTVECGPCGGAPEGTVAFTRSASDGTFRLRSMALDEGGTFTLVTERGYFRHVERRVVVPACGDLELGSAATTLPGRSSGDDTAPRIAVASAAPGTAPLAGNVNDDFARILDLIGVDFVRFDPNRSGLPAPDDMLTLLSTPEMLAEFQVLVVPCGALGVFSVGPNLTPEIVENLRAWLAAGGRLYASDLAYEVVARSVPGAIVFAPGPSHVPMADPADVGQGIDTLTTLTARIDDAELLAWLEIVGAVADGTSDIVLSDLRDPWAAIDDLSMGARAPDAMGRVPALSLVSGEVTWHTAPTAVHPLTVMVDVEGGAGEYCGRVVFSSYHAQTSRDDRLAPQERVLQYLLFELSGCVRTP